MILCPKLFFASGVHLAPALWASMHIPPVNPVRTTYLLSYHFYTQLALDILPIYNLRIDAISIRTRVAPTPTTIFTCR